MMKEFTHGGDIFTMAKELDCDVSEIIDLSSNINFVKPHIDIDFNKLPISHYPSYDTLYHTISKEYNTSIKSIELFNGATSAISSLFAYLRPKAVTIYSPAYLEYKRVAKLYNSQIKYIDRFKDINDEVISNSLVIFVNPSTPDGKYYNISKFIKEWINKNCTILIDESFLEFEDNKSVVEYIKEYDRLYILKSMTKFYGSAGIRIGALISNPKNIQEIKSKEPLWKISQFDSQYIISALKDKSFKDISKAKNREVKERLIKILQKSSLVEKIYPSDANFILVKLNIDASTLQKRLLRYKILIRDCSNFDGLDSSFVRVAVKDIWEFKNK